MGWKRATLPATVALMLFASGWLDWWTASEEGFGVEAGVRGTLIGARACVGSLCEGVPAPGGWQVVGPVTLVAVGITGLLFAIAAFFAATNRDSESIVGVTRRACTVVLALTGIAMIDVVVNLHAMPSWGALLGGGGAALGLIARAAQIADDSFGASRSDAPVRVVAVAAAPVRLPSARVVRDDGLRFVVKSGALTATGLRVELENGTARELAWTEVSHVVARRLPPDPPFEKAAFLDLVPRDGAPVRLLATSRLDYASLPGGAAPNTKENWRRLVQLAHDAHPALQVERASVAFFEGGDAPMFPALKLFVEYDRRYG